MSVSGVGPFAYQWRKNGSGIVGATESTFTLPAVQSADAGLYSVVVSNVSGAVTSLEALLTVSAPPPPTRPVISAHPANKSVLIGQVATFSVSATGQGTLTYQWSKNGVTLSGATQSTYAIASAQLSDAGDYTVVVVNEGGFVQSNTATLTVRTAFTPTGPTIILQPFSQTTTLTGTVTFSVTATSDTPVSYQWIKDGAPIAQATSASLTIRDARFLDAGSYAVFITNAHGVTVSDFVTLTVNPIPASIAPSLATQPGSQEVQAGANVTFSVVAHGSAPLSYQWRKNGLTIAGATQAVFSLNGVQPNDAGTYSVIVTNPVGAAISANAILSVAATPAMNAPVFTSQPQSRTVVVNDPVTLSVSVQGTAPFTYQWKKDSVAIAGATTASYTIASAQLTHAGVYTVSVSNPGGTAQSAPAVLTVNPPSPANAPTIITHPASQVVNSGTAVVLSVVAQGSGSLTYQWRKNGVSLPGANAPTFTLASSQTSDSGIYSVVVVNQAGSTASNNATLQVNATSTIVAPSIASQPQAVSATVGGNASFTVTAAGSVPMSFAWMKDGVEIAGAVQPTLVLSNLQLSDRGHYTVIVRNAGGIVTSAQALLTVTPAPTLGVPTILAHPVPQTVNAGDPAVFSVTAQGNMPLSYQWRQNGVPIAGATQSSFKLNSVGLVDAGRYSVVVTNSVGASLSREAVLTVLNAPTPPLPQTA
ncbi:MAG TPA: immunoglobulin domain-containing protein, partial [Opitutaceae bacterium]|nr:immunoglobulin domain-containing protein [Opitutaceae bacterium]